MEPTNYRAQSAIIHRGPVGWTSPLKETQNKEIDQEENDQREIITSTNNIIRQRVSTPTCIRN